MDEIDIAICILFHEKVEQTIECISSFLTSGCSIYVLNNNSSKQSTKLLLEFINDLEHVVYLSSPKNLGVANGRNLLISSTGEDWLFFVDNDIHIITQDWKQKLSDIIDKNWEIDIFIPKLYNLHENGYVDYSFNIVVQGQKYYLYPSRSKNINWFPGGASIVNRNIFQKNGLYDKDMFVGGEDFEFAIRAILFRDHLCAALIDNIELIHDHRFARNQNDEDATRIRYSRELQQKSFLQLYNKHFLLIDDRWEGWSHTQERYILKSKRRPIYWQKWVPTVGKRVYIDLIQRRVLPRSCSLFMTTRCNFRCKGCRRLIDEEVKAIDMEVDVVQRLLSLYPSVKFFTLAGFGEPTLSNKFGDIVEFLITEKKHMGIITNGSNIKPILSMSKYPNYVSFSLYGYDSGSYSDYTGTNEFEKIIENFEILKQNGYNVGCSFIINRENYMQLDKIMDLCDDLQPTFLHLHNYLPYSIDEERVSKIITVEDIQIRRYIDIASKNKKFYIHKPIPIDVQNPVHCCKSHNYVINLDAYGNIGGCMRQIPPDEKFGNIFSSDNPFQSDGMKSIQNKLKKNDDPFELCKYCFGNYK